MYRYLGMVAVCLVVGGSLSFIFLWFIRKLRRIESDFWDKQK